jgi:hypothetical protein
MARELSEMLSDMANQSKKIEDAFAAIAVETDAQAEQRREATRAAANAAVDRLDQSVSAASDTMAGHWRALTGRIDAEFKDMQAGIAERRHARDLSHAQHEAEAAQERAQRAIEFAVAAIQVAGVAVLDAADAQKAAEALKRG